MTTPAAIPVERHFATVTGRFGTRQVHYRRAGTGPVVVLLHQSPQSSRELVPLMGEWARHFTVIAPDSPGYGQSDPLGIATATLDDFAAAVVEFLDALGVTRFAVYGFHTGGMIGIALAHRHPARVTAAVCNGVAVLTAAEREEYLRRYFPPFVPAWDGSHLAWLWSRIREQNVFFPWHEPTRSARMDFPATPPDRAQVSVVEFLRAADHYEVAYRAAFNYRAEEVVKEIAVPTLLTAAALDPIGPHLRKLGAHAPAVEITPAADSADALARALAHLASRPGDPGPPSPAPTLAVPPVPGRPWRGTLAIGGCCLNVRRAGTGRPLLVLHGAGRSGATLEAVRDAFAPARAVFVPDLPGHGDSDALPAGAAALDSAVAAAAAVLAAAGEGPVDVLGIGGGAVLALALARVHPGRLGRTFLVDPPAPSDEARAILRAGIDRSGVDWYGGHLLRAWHTVRDGRLYYPWCRRDRAGIRWIEPDLDPRRLHPEVLELLKAEGAWQDLLVAEFDFPFAKALAAVPDAVLAVTPGHPAPDAVRTLAAGRHCRELPVDPAPWPALLETATP